MRSKRRIPILAVLVAACLISAACDKFNVPRFSHDPVGGPVAPISVRVVLDQQLEHAIFTQPVCDNQLWEGLIAEVLAQNIRDAGRTRFKSTQVVVASETAASSQSPADYQVLLRLVNKDFVGKDRTGSTDQYMARIDLDLAATYQALLPDGTVRTMGEGPLRYSDNVSIFTPRVGQAGGRCLTGELDATLAKASRALTDQLFSVVAQLPAGGPSTAVAGAASGPVGTMAMPQPAVAAPMILRVSLLDDNKNHILEPGEKIGLRVDATNTGAGVITHAPLSLGGTPSLIDAFTQSGAGSPDLGPINPGATKSTVLWGRMPSSLAADRGELTVSVTPSWIDQRGAAATSAAVGQTLVAAIRSGGNTIAEGQNVGGPASVSPADHNRLALVVAVRHYRDPWPGADAKPAADPAQLAASLQQKLGVSKDRLMLLEDELANRLDIEEALTRWLSERIGREALLFVYFLGHTIVDAQTGEVYLVPYDAAPDAPLYRFLPLRRLHSHLNQLDAKLSLVFIDGSQSRVNSTSGSGSASPGSSKSRKTVTPASPNWQGALNGAANGKGLIIQFARRETQGTAQAGHFLAGLDGSSDLDQDGQVTVGELLRSLKGRAVTVPLVSASSPELNIVLSR